MFCEKFNLELCEVVVVGDMLIDLYLVKNGDCYVIGVLFGIGDCLILELFVDLVLDFVGEFIF